MTITARQSSAWTVESSSVTSLSATLPAAPVSGNIIVYFLIVDKASGTLTQPTGFSTPSTSANTNVSGMMVMKTSDGTESGAISGSWSTARPAKCRVVEFQASGTIGFGAFATPVYQGTNSAGITTNAVSAPADTNLLIALIGKDSAKNAADPDPGSSWTDSFSTYAIDWSVPTDNGEPAIAIGLRTVSGSGSYSTTFSHDGNTDQWVAFLAALTETGGGGSSAANYYHQQNQ